MRPRSRWRPAVTGTPSDALLRRLDRKQSDQDSERKVEKALRESGGSAPTADRAQAKLPGDPESLRGIPALARGVGGTQKGTQPERETLERERHAERRRTRFDSSVE